MENKDIKIFNGETLPEKKKVSQNENLMQIRSNYVAAMMVPKPRVMNNVINAVMKEAEQAKDDFYYNWLVNNKRTGSKELIEGGTTGLAQAIIRNWTNCAVETEVKEFAGEWIYKTTCIDFENGFTIQREYRLKIPQEKSGNYDYERTRNMKFQMGYSKNQRDCIFNFVPRWLRAQAIETAKRASVNDVEKNIDGNLKKALSSFANKDITEKDLLGYFGKKSINEFDAKIVAQLRNLWVQLNNGETSVEAIKESAKEVFDRSSKKQDIKQPEPKKSKPKEQKKKVSEFDLIMKSFGNFGITKSEICAYFNIEDVEELNVNEGILELRSIITSLEGGGDPQEFKNDAARRLEERMK